MRLLRWLIRVHEMGKAFTVFSLEEGIQYQALGKTLWILLGRNSFSTQVFMLHAVTCTPKVRSCPLSLTGFRPNPDTHGYSRLTLPLAPILHPCEF
jgi:hypothetical protein